VAVPSYLDFAKVAPPSGPFADLVPRFAAEYGVPQSVLTWVGGRENGWRHGAAAPQGIPTSTGRAKGPWQFMDATWKEQANPGEDPNDPEASTRAAAKYLRSLYDRTGSWTEAVRRYGTFSSGRGREFDQALEAGFLSHMIDSGTDPKFSPERGGTGDYTMRDGSRFVARRPAVAASPDTPQSPLEPPMLNMPIEAGADAAPSESAGGFSGPALLRLAQMAGSRTWGEGVRRAGAALSQGMVQDAQMEQAEAAGARAAQAQDITIRDKILQRAAQLSEDTGMAPGLALRVAMQTMTGGAGGGAIPPEIDSLPARQPKTTAGQVGYGPDGKAYTMSLTSSGQPVFHDTTGQKVEGGVPGWVPATQAGLKEVAKADVEAHSGAVTVANESQKVLPVIDGALRAMETEPFRTGTTVVAQLQSFFERKFDGDKAAARQAVENLLGQIRMGAMGAFKGLGAMSDRDMEALKAALPNIDQDPRAMRTALRILQNQHLYNVKTVQDFYNDPDAKETSFRRWHNAYKQRNPAPSIDVQEVVPAARPPLTTFAR
jgi:hypothetical protein